mgnify:CR=1 FL=1
MKKDSLKTRFLVQKARPGLGYGLFATAPVRKGNLISEYSGKRIPTPYADTLKTRYLFEIDREWTIDGSSRENIARYINHSCDPNCECELRSGRIFIYAARDIQEEEELTFDYGDEYFDEFIRPQGCRCMKCAVEKRLGNLRSG